MEKQLNEKETSTVENVSLLVQEPLAKLGDRIICLNKTGDGCYDILLPVDMPCTDFSLTLQFRKRHICDFSVGDRTASLIGTNVTFSGFRNSQDVYERFNIVSSDSLKDSEERDKAEEQMPFLTVVIYSVKEEEYVSRDETDGCYSTAKCAKPVLCSDKVKSLINYRHVPGERDSMLKTLVFTFRYAKRDIF